MCDNQLPVVAISSSEMLSGDPTDSNTLTIVFSPDDPGELTDIDVYEMSDAGEEEAGRATPGYSVDKFVEFENTFQETLKLNEQDPSQTLLQSDSVSNSCVHSMLSIPEALTDEGHTDVEDIDDDEGDIEIEEVDYTEDDLRIIDTILGESGSVDIADQLRGTLSLSPSPAVTPEPTTTIKKIRRTPKSPRKSPKKKFLTPTALSDEFSGVSSHSEDERAKTPGLRGRRRRSRSPRNLLTPVSPGGLTDVEDLELSSAEDPYQGQEAADLPFEFPTHSRISISRQSFLRPLDVSAPDTEAEDIPLSDQEDFEGSLHVPQGSTLAVSPEPTEAVTDCEELNFEQDELNALKKMEEYYGSVSVMHGTRTRHKSHAKVSSCTSSDDEPEPKMRTSIKRRVPKITLQKADQEESSDQEESLDVKKKSPIECLTDHEDLRMTESDCGSRRGSSSQGLHIPVQDVGCLTDTEMYEDEESLRPCTPEPDDEDTDERIPPPVRELTLLKEVDEGRPESVVMPLGDAQPQGLLMPAVETGGITDTEDVPGESDDEYEISECKSPDLPDFEGGTVESSDSLKIQKKRSKLLVPDDDQHDLLTDTEDVYVGSSGSKRKKNKTRSSGRPKLTLSPEVPSHGTSEVEEIELSDFESRVKEPASNNNLQYLNVQQVQGEKTDVEDMSGTSGPDEEDDVTDGRATPDCLKNYGIEIVTTQEGDGPFSIEERQNILNNTVGKGRSSFGAESATEGAIHTDVEDDLLTSTDEELVRSARVSIDAEQTIVLDKNIRRFNLDPPEEAQYVKGQLLSDVNTDVEEVGFSEEEITGRIAVIDSRPEVCVCMTARPAGDLESSVCVCVARGHDRLTLVSGNTTNLPAGGVDASKTQPTTLEAEAPEDEEADSVEEKQ